MRRRGRVIGLLVAGAVLGLVALLWRPAAKPPAPVSPGTLADTPRFPPALGAEAPTMAPLTIPARTGPRELCGWGRFEPTPTTFLPTPVEQEADQALRQLASSLIASDPRSKARGLALRATLDYHGGLAVHGDDPKAIGAAFERAAARSSADRRALAKLALGSSDIEIYKAAYLSCVVDTAIDTCAQLSAAEWARRDPSDGLAWLFVAQEAHNAKYLSARDEAFYRLSQASRMSGGWQSTSAHASDPSLSTLSTPTRIGAVLSLMLLQASSPVPSYGAVVDYCPKDVAKDPVRREHCSALATVLTQHDTTLIGAAMGLAIANRVGWPPARLEALRDERDALSLVSNDVTLVLLNDPTSCAGFASFNRFVEEHGRLGELGLLRERIRQSGEPVSVLAQRWRARQAAEIEAAKAAASGATGTQAR